MQHGMQAAITAAVPARYAAALTFVFEMVTIDFS